MAETLSAPRAEFDIEDPWSAPAACEPVRLRRSTDASVPRLATHVAAWYDDECLSVLFSCADDHVEATHVAHDAPLYEEDVVEVFLAPDELTHYYELEVSPRGTLFDAAVDSPHGDRASMHVDRGWTCEGLAAAVRKVTESDGGITIDTLIRIPFAGLARRAPRKGEIWRANFFRIDRHPRHGDEYSAWQPTMKTPPDFHVPRAFGALLFQ
ncbi:MAG TPA: carbohydrate-binding family 9-like protein [Thermoanaerobaculia bacterium]|nr:carbohydrate-binding family 9-like protein [Thermoanaerobaculia bacterium]